MCDLHVLIARLRNRHSVTCMTTPIGSVTDSELSTENTENSRLKTFDSRQFPVMKKRVKRKWWQW